MSLALICLGVLAALSLWLSALSVAIKLPLALLAFAYGLWLARREATGKAFSAQWTADGRGLSMHFVDRTVQLIAVTAMVRGPLGCVAGCDQQGRTRRLLWCPDTLPAPSRRKLRLLSGNQMVESGPALATMQG